MWWLRHVSVIVHALPAAHCCAELATQQVHFHSLQMPCNHSMTIVVPAHSSCWLVSGTPNLQEDLEDQNQGKLIYIHQTKGQGPS